MFNHCHNVVDRGLPPLSNPARSAKCKNEKATRQLGGLFFKGE